MQSNSPMSFVMAMRAFFGMKEGQTLTQFAAEVRTLDEADRAYFTRELVKQGFVIQ